MKPYPDKFKEDSEKLLVKFRIGWFLMVAVMFAYYIRHNFIK